jgi:hypothetical protein
MVHQIFFVLKHIDCGLTLRTDDESILPCLKIAYEAGYRPAVQYAYRFCRENNIPMNEPQATWVRGWQDSVLNDAARMVPNKKSGPT